MRFSRRFCFFVAPALSDRQRRLIPSFWAPPRGQVAALRCGFLGSRNRVFSLGGAALVLRGFNRLCRFAQSGRFCGSGAPLKSSPFRRKTPYPVRQDLKPLRLQGLDLVSSFPRRAYRSQWHTGRRDSSRRCICPGRRVKSRGQGLLRA